jgi:4-hydroxybenzoate polyprenyltransferase
VILIFLIGYFSLAKPQSADTTLLVFGVISFFCAVSFSNIFNDIKDIEIDRLNDKKRPLTEGIIWITEATIAALIFVALAILTALASGSFVIVSATLASLFLGYAYSDENLCLAKRGLTGTISLVVGYVFLPLVAGMFIAGNFNTFSLSLLAFLVTETGMRLLFKDYADEKGDMRYGKMTPLLIYGEKIIGTLSNLLIVIAGIAYVLGVKPTLEHTAPILSVFVTIAAIVVLVSGFLVTRKAKARLQSIKTLRVFHMVMVVLILLCLIYRQ